MSQLVREWAGIWLSIIFVVGILYAVRSLIQDIRRHR